MTTTTTTTVPLRRRPRVRFALHYLEMLVAMAAGMVLLAPVWTVVPGVPDGGIVPLLLMVLDMTAGMGAWMKVRGHSWAGTAEMCAWMAAPFLLLLPPYAVGAVSEGTVTGTGHVLMLGTMLVAMLRRRAEYACH